MKLTYNYYDNRYYIGSHALHCGDHLQVLINDTWVDTRIEMTWDQKWYLVGIVGVDLEGLQVKED